ncbi:hypothetical protein [Actinophytocola sp.]|uniref:hypothetical protein n=1 Tax=Actinophytocola sp. TaxID=1872138 RepID=UPI002D758488|nr:hypothetical protein [Actinophytocola sp.]HYQ69167.1 hypothetical protein [Actinophytocola sp.]
MRPRHMFPTVALAAVLPVVAGCTSSAATTQERIVYLRQVAAQGAETGDLLRDQEAPDIDKARCARAFEGLTRPEDYPADQDNGSASKEWAAQIREFFIDSCVSGKPKSAPGDTDTTTTSTTTTTPDTTTAITTTNAPTSDTATTTTTTTTTTP